MKLYLIRHASTKGNEERRYIGRFSDENLSEKGRRESKNTYENFTRNLNTDLIISQNSKRCIETAKILFPTKSIEITDKFYETDFGKFEGKNYLELKGDISYQNWINSNGTLPFPDGDNTKEYKNIICYNFKRFILELNKENVTLITHGGCIMAIMEKFCGGDYYKYQIKPCTIIRCEAKNSTFLEEGVYYFGNSNDGYQL